MRPGVRRRFEPIADLELEEYLCGDLSGDELARVDVAIQNSPDLRKYVAERRAERHAFFAKQPALPRAESPKRMWPSRRLWLAAAGVAATLLVSIFWTTGELPPGDPGGGRIRAMGAVKATLAILRDDTVFSYRTGVLLRPGDRVRLTVEAPTKGYLTVLGVEEGGRVSVYYDGLQTTHGAFTVPDSLVLDDYVGEEVWYVIVGARKVPVAFYVRRIQNNEPVGADTAMLHIVKEELP